MSRNIGFCNGTSICKFGQHSCISGKSVHNATCAYIKWHLFDRQESCTNVSTGPQSPAPAPNQPNQPTQPVTVSRPAHAKEYSFLDIELRYGLLQVNMRLKQALANCVKSLMTFGRPLFKQITEALTFLHYSGHIIHRNVCPSSILVTTKGTWKLAGLEFSGKRERETSF